MIERTAFLIANCISLILFIGLPKDSSSLAKVYATYAVYRHGGRTASTFYAIYQSQKAMNTAKYSFHSRDVRACDRMQE